MTDAKPKTEKEDALRFGALGTSAIHLCVDMQNLFARETDWHTPWMERVLPKVERLARARPEQTVFTRFVPLRNARAGVGTWRRYYERWKSMTLDELPAGMVDLMPSLAELVPPASVVDKTTYGPWVDEAFDAALKARGVDTLVVTGGETDVCVLATVLGAIDRGYRTVIVTDALCSSSDEAHDALLLLYRSRYGYQVETATTDVVLDGWEPDAAAA